MATISNKPASEAVAPLPTVALVPGKPETRMRLSTIIKKEREEQKEQDKKLDNNQKQAQSSTVVNISAKAKELNRAAPVDQTSSTAKTGSATDQTAKIPGKENEAERPAAAVQPPANAGNTTTRPKTV
ncbi:MAG: hypothetical protein WAW10_13535 [Gallionella sp.]